MYMERHEYYWTCPYCGSNLDPGERCDCRDEKKTPDKTSNVVDNYKSVRGGEDNGVS